MRHLGLTGIAMLLLGLTSPASASAAFSDYGVASVDASLSSSEAGAHPDFNTVINIKTDPGEPLDAFGHEKPYAGTKSIEISLPPGLVGNPNAVAQCTTAQFATAFDESENAGCPMDSQVGVTVVKLYLFPTQLTAPIYNMEAPGGEHVARLAFYAATLPVFINVHLRSDDDYGLTATVDGIPANELLISADTTLWGVPASSSHDTLRLTAREGYPEAKQESPPRRSGLAPEPFLTNPTACGGDLEIGFVARSYPLPEQKSSAAASLPPIDDCGKLGFDPVLEVTPTSRRAAAPAGLEASLEIPQNETVGGRATSQLKDAIVKLPEGLSIASGAADGLAACSEQEVGYRTRKPSNCPEASKIANVELDVPALSRVLKGAVYQRSPEPGRLFRIWLVTDELGVHVKLPGEIEANPVTGQLTSLFLDNPQVPFKELRLRFKGGSRGVVATPPSCGTYQTHYELTPWSGNAPIAANTPMTIDEACDTGGFSPKLSGGSTNPTAGSFSRFVLNLTRNDGEQNVAGLDVVMPPGLLAKLAGIPLCPAGLAMTGDCDPASRVGATMVAAGPGPLPLWIPQPGKDPTVIYLSGPYKGAPYSLVVKTPAQAGPFDLGVVVVRAAIHIDPATAQVTVKSDPLPQILEGVPISYRTIHVDVNRPDFTLNPTSCDPMSIGATAASDRGTHANLAQRFQVGNCAGLGFKPRLYTRLFGPTRRSAHPRLRAILVARPGDANIARAAVTLPRSQLLDQENIRTVCTRVQFAARACPEASIYGRARAISPLLDQPLEGPVYLRSSNNLLPDLVAALRGQVDVDLVGRIDSTRGGIRTTFDVVPDAPITKFVLTMQGGGKGLLVNSRNLCRKSSFSIVKLDGHNGKMADQRPRMNTGCRAPKGAGRAGLDRRRPGY
jgi:hypothetical protein